MNGSTTIPDYFHEDYITAIKLAISGNEEKALKQFAKIGKKSQSEKFSLLDHYSARYQVSHYEYFGKFDIYYNGVLPSIMDRSKNLLTEKQKKKYKKIFNKCGGGGFRSGLYEPAVFLTDYYNNCFNPSKYIDEVIKLKAPNAKEEYSWRWKYADERVRSKLFTDSLYIDMFMRAAYPVGEKFDLNKYVGRLNYSCREYLLSHSSSPLEAKELQELRM